MAPSPLEAGARNLVTRFLGSFISTGSLTLLEDYHGGKTLTFEGNDEQCSLKCMLRVHDPQFYWKVMTRADIGLADSYIDGDFSVDDKDEGILNLFTVLIANRDANKFVSNTKRGWWRPLLFTAAVASMTFFFQHVLRQNSNRLAGISLGIMIWYEIKDLTFDKSNEVFALFLGEIMTYSSGIFKTEDEDLEAAQLRKISVLIEKARIDSEHEVLDVGCGWGTFAIEVVKRTGCKYTGITLSEQQLKFAEMKVKEAGLQDKISLQLCDYRQLPANYKCDRIISCEMIEHVGHEYMEEFFRCCESVLAEDGLLVLQFIAIPDERYDGYRRSSDFIKEYIFPGGCLPSFSRVTSAMASASRLCVEHVENIGSHYYTTLRCWRKNFSQNQSKILEMGFDEKFVRTWEYYFDYCAAGFKSYTLGDYQVVFSRPGSIAALGYPYKGFPSAY